MALRAASEALAAGPLEPPARYPESYLGSEPPLLALELAEAARQGQLRVRGPRLPAESAGDATLLAGRCRAYQAGRVSRAMRPD